jgi:hypothetical protein
MMTNEVLTDLWVVMLEHITPKLRDDAATDFVNTLLDHNIKESDLLELQGVDDYLDNAIDYAVDSDESEIL